MPPVFILCCITTSSDESDLESDNLSVLLSQVQKKLVPYRGRFSMVLWNVGRRSLLSWLLYGTMQESLKDYDDPTSPSARLEADSRFDDRGVGLVTRHTHLSSGKI